MNDLVRKPGKSNLIPRPKHSYPDTMIGRPLEIEENPNILPISTV